MSRIGSLAIACLLLIAGFGDAARTPRQRSEQRNPYLILPPDISTGVEDGKLPESLGERVFSLRHVYHHGSHRNPTLHRYIDIPKDAHLQVLSDDGLTREAAPLTLHAKAVATSIQRLADRRRATIDSLLEHAGQYGVSKDLPSSAWTIDELAGPNVTDKETVVTFAKMAANAYVTEPFGSGWEDIGSGYNYTDDFGWEQDGLRGHIYADETNGTVVIGLKGTSMAVFDGADTTGNDKLNDNLFGSCCCGQGGQYLWKQVCDCMTSTYTCNSTCLVKSLREKSHYYWAVRDLYHNVTARYPNADVWMSGHSLGGVVSALLGLTYGLPTITYETFPDALAASRLGLPTPPGYGIGLHHSRAKLGIYHFGHTADPIFMGTCNAASSLCTLGGYAFQGICHTGQTCVFDTVGDLGWRPGIGNHRITSVIKGVLQKYDEMPKCEEDVECQDCFNWKFYESNGTESTTSSSSSSTSTMTRTETCKTPGWWGCLDESTTTTGSTTSTSSTTTSTSSSTTCKTPGWFGCKDETTTSSSSTSTSTKLASTPSPAPVPSVTATSNPPESTTTCKSPGWFGCNDPSTTSSVAKPSPTSAHTTATATSSTTSCTSSEWFGLICVDPSPDSASSASPTARPSSVPTTSRRCVKRSWYGRCNEWSTAGEVGYNMDL